LPGIYLILKGVISYQGFLLVALSSTLISDSLWYALGRALPYEKIVSLPILKNKKQTIQNLLGKFQNNGLKIIFISKFVYGSRIITQILGGFTKIRYWKYLAANTLTALAWLNFIFLSAYLANKGLTMTDISFPTEISLAIIIILIFIFYQWSKKQKQKFL